jgi:hypothetical protein
MQHDTYLRLKHLVGDKRAGIAPMIPITGMTWWRWVKARKAPQPIRLTPRTVVWRSSDVRRFIEAGGTSQ